VSGFERLPDGVYRWRNTLLLQSTFHVPAGWEWFRFESDTWVSGQPSSGSGPVRVRPEVTA
jgi:hypothetical protein